jgi:hypothetical protein
MYDSCSSFHNERILLINGNFDDCSDTSATEISEIYQSSVLTHSLNVWVTLQDTAD